MSVPTQQKVWILANPPVGPFEKDTFKLETRPLPELKDGQLLVKLTYLSNDPAQRGWMQKDQDSKRSYAPPILKGDPVRSIGQGTVVSSKSSKFAVGDNVISSSMIWADYLVLNEDAVTSKAIELPGKPYAGLSVLGMPAVTAYQGIYDILDVKPEHTVLVSGAAGTVGSTAIQLAKNVIGAKRVVGIAGGKEKCDWVKSLGADECVDYKDPNFKANLSKALQGYADRYFENVGGDIMDAAFPNIARHGKIALCGMIANYLGEPPKFPKFGEVITNRITIQGFIVIDFLPRWQEAVTKMAAAIKEGKLSVADSETIVSGPVDVVPEKYQLLFSGQSRGKLLTAIDTKASL